MRMSILKQFQNSDKFVHLRLGNGPVAAFASPVFDLLDELILAQGIANAGLATIAQMIAAVGKVLSKKETQIF